MEQSRRVSHADLMDCSPHPVSTTGDLPFGGYASNPRPERHRSIRSGAVKDAGCEWIATQQCVAGERINHSDPESCRPAEGSQTMVQCTKSHPTGRLLWDPHHGYTKPGRICTQTSATTQPTARYVSHQWGVRINLGFIQLICPGNHTTQINVHVIPTGTIYHLPSMVDFSD